MMLNKVSFAIVKVVNPTFPFCRSKLKALNLYASVEFNIRKIFSRIAERPRYSIVISDIQKQVNNCTVKFKWSFHVLVKLICFSFYLMYLFL